MKIITQPKSNRLRALTQLGLCAVALAIGSATSFAAPGSTPVRDIADGIFNPYGTVISFLEGNGVGYSASTSVIVPSTNRTELTEISCLCYGGNSSTLILNLTVTCGGTQVTHRFGPLSRS